jgi:hypothetical protein
MRNQTPKNTPQTYPGDTLECVLRESLVGYPNPGSYIHPIIKTEMTLQEQLRDAAQCLMGISDDWDYFDIEQFLDWQLDHLDELPEGYPIEVMTREYESDIMAEVDYLMARKLWDGVDKGLGLKR